MDRQDLDECETLGATILGYLLANVPISAESGTPGAQIHADVGATNANAGALIKAGGYAAAMSICFDDAVACGMDLNHMSRVRQLILMLTPVSLSATLLVEMAEYFALIEESKIIAALTFVSRDQVEALIAQVYSEFDNAINEAADREGDSSVYQSLIALHAALVGLLVSSAYRLPVVVDYTIGKSVPSLVLAQMLYGDASRADQLAAGNNVINPAFMPLDGTALSA